MIKVGERNEKYPKDMVNMELLEVYSHYSRMPVRMQEEQDYIGLLRKEMLKRMESGSDSQGKQ